MADLIRGKEVNKTLIYFNITKDAALSLEKLLRSALSNWEQKMKVKHGRRKFSELVLFKWIAEEC